MTHENKISIMVVDNEATVLKSIVMTLITAEYRAIPFSSAKQAYESLENKKEKVDIIITDINMPGIDGYQFINMIKNSSNPDIPILVLTGYGTIESAVKALRVGASGFFEKDKDPELLLFEINRIAQNIQAKNKIKDLTNQLESRDSDFYIFSSKNKKTNEVFLSARHIAAKNVDILITGESGTGKEVLARWVHKLSSRKNGRFLSVNCNAIPDSLFESEMF